MHTAQLPDAPVQEQQETSETTTPVRRQPLGFDARLAAADQAVADRCREALLRLDVDSALPATRLDLADVVRGPVQLLEEDEDLEPYPTPAAATLQRAARRLATGGWCQGTVVDEDGARCLYGAIRIEAPTEHTADDALAVLLDVIRRRWPDAGTVPEANDYRLRDGHTAVQLLDDAARVADARGI